MRIAVVGDVHGHLELMYAILGRWQRESGERLDLILQCGDMGTHRSADMLDRATRKHAAQDPEELGFAAFAGPSPPVTALDPRPPLVFIPGNHEDFAFLEECERRALRGDGQDEENKGNLPPAVYPVSDDGSISALRSGEIWSFAAADSLLRVAGVSGAAGRARKRHQHARLHLDEDGALGLAAAGPGAFDVLISHDGPTDVWQRGWAGRGSAALRLLIEEVQPRVAFFGHYDHPGAWTIGVTPVFALAGCGYEPHAAWRLKQGGIALLRCDGEGVVVERLEADWLRVATRESWRHWPRLARR